MNSDRVRDAFCPVHRLGTGTGHHFFGYYNKTPWDAEDRRVLALEVDRLTGDLTGRETARVGYFPSDRAAEFRVIDETTTWNWQMGCQLQWLNAGRGDRIVYNIRTDPETRADMPFPEFGARIRNVETGDTTDLPLPVYVAAPDGSYALSVNYSRFMLTHKTIGYASQGGEPPLANAPEDDGIYHMDLASGAWRLVLSLAQLTRVEPLPSMDKAVHWVTHLEINPASSRVLFIHRWTERVADETCFLHRLFTMNPDGSDLKLLECTDHPLPQLADDFDPDAVGTFDYEKSEYQISHPMWADDGHVIVWGPHRDEIHYHLYDDRTGKAEIVGPGVLTENGHMTFSSDARWLLSDTYPDAATNIRLLILYDMQTGIRYNIGSFATDPDLGKHNRCDLHPRWSRDNSRVCIDSVHEGERQMYVIDVSGIVSA